MKVLITSILAASLASASAPHDSVKQAFSQPLPNVPGKSLMAMEIDYPPGGVSRPHRHPASAFIFAYVLSGDVRSAMNGAPARIYHPGQSWSEPPGTHHTICENASKTEPARLLAVFVVDTGTRKLVTPDPS